ncbi:MAG: CpaB family protein [Candidatus Nanopelagicales bacterium]
MARSPAEPAGPQVRRIGRARWGDVRLWLGLLLVAASMLVGARLMAAGDDTVTVLRATRDLSVGARLDGLVPVRLPRDAAQPYLGQPVDGVLRWPVLAGELVPRSAVATSPPEPTRQVTVPVDPLHAPPGLRPGDRVDVWSSPRGPADAAGPPVLVLASVPVASASSEQGLGGEVGVVLDVPVDDVAGIVAASRSGVVDLVAVPAASGLAPSAGRAAQAQGR